jgi:hypothetical protein
VTAFTFPPFLSRRTNFFLSPSIAVSRQPVSHAASVVEEGGIGWGQRPARYSRVADARAARGL